MIFSNRDAHYSPLFSQLGLIKLMALVTIHTALFMFQYHHNLLPKAFDNFFSRISPKHNCNTRLASNQLTILITLELITVNLIYTSLVLLFGNNLDEELKSSYLCLFKQAMMKNFLSVYICLT